jgi:hypothetical protein
MSDPIALVPVVEHALLMAGGGMHVRYSDPQSELIYPLERWIDHQLMFGGQVFRRTVIVVEDWTEITPISARERTGDRGESSPDGPHVRPGPA